MLLSNCLRFGSAALAWHARWAWAPFPQNVMFLFLFCHSLVFLPALNLSGDICNSDSTAVSPLGILKTVMSRSCSGNPFRSHRQSVAPSGFHSRRQHKHCSPRPRPWYSCPFLISGTSRCMRGQKCDSAPYSAVLSETHFKSLSSVCVTE